jgi:hypothetical protein
MSVDVESHANNPEIKTERGARSPSRKAWGFCVSGLETSVMSRRDHAEQVLGSTVEGTRRKP